MACSHNENWSLESRVWLSPFSCVQLFATLWTVAHQLPQGLNPHLLGLLH